MTYEQQADKQIAEAMESFPISTPSPAMIAYLVIQDVMRRNAEAHIAAGDMWEERSEKYHLTHADKHTWDALLASAGLEELPDEAIQDAEHALCRLGMALAKRRMRIGE